MNPSVFVFLVGLLVCWFAGLLVCWFAGWFGLCSLQVLHRNWVKYCTFVDATYTYYIQAHCLRVHSFISIYASDINTTSWGPPQICCFVRGVPVMLGGLEEARVYLPAFHAEISPDERDRSFNGASAPNSIMSAPSSTSSPSTKFVWESVNRP